MNLVPGWTTTRQPSDHRANPHHRLDPVPAGTCHAVPDDGNMLALCDAHVIITGPGAWPPTMVSSADICRDCKTAQPLAAWWAGLDDRDRVELLGLRYGDELPARLLPTLTSALGLGPVGVRWQGQPGYTFTVDDRLGAFVEQQRGSL